MAAGVEIIMLKEQELLLIIKFLSGISAGDQTSATEPMESLQMISKQISRCWKIIFVLTSPVGIKRSGIPQDFFNGEKNLTPCYQKMLFRNSIHSGLSTIIQKV